MNIYAFYLPQFHRVKENDEWWGEGFTDWVSCKNATPQFENHYQPHVPFNNDYYDLMQKEAWIRQAELMHLYGIDGMCIYHYWFGDGKQILEKPVESLLKWHDIDMPFCFYWANQSWINSWSGLRGNAWITNETKNDNKPNILMKQLYGREDEWKAHFDYMLKFFKDKRYILKDGKPLIIILNVSDIPNFPMMYDYWNELAIEAGFPGIYVIGSEAQNVHLDGVLIREPNYARRHLQKINTSPELTIFSYQEATQLLKNTRVKAKASVYYCSFSNFDSTPRQGKKGTVFVDYSPKALEDNVLVAMQKNQGEGNDITFIDAWNEWGEGMHLEPDVENGFGYLEAIRDAKERMATGNADIMPEIEYNENYRDKHELERLKYEKYLNRLDEWMSIREAGHNIEEWLSANDYKRICIYGFGIYSKHLINELEGTSIEIVGLIDRERMRKRIAIPMYTLDDEIPECDCIVVTSFFYLQDIYRAIVGVNKSVSVVSIEEIINDMSM